MTIRSVTRMMATTLCALTIAAGTTGVAQAAQQSTGWAPYFEGSTCSSFGSVRTLIKWKVPGKAPADLTVRITYENDRIHQNFGTIHEGPASSGEFENGLTFPDMWVDVEFYDSKYRTKKASITFQNPTGVYCGVGYKNEGPQNSTWPS